VAEGGQHHRTGVAGALVVQGVEVSDVPEIDAKACAGGAALAKQDSVMAFVSSGCGSTPVAPRCLVSGIRAVCEGDTEVMMSARS
jgi:hypothetical protein